MKLKTSLSIFWCHTWNWSQLELLKDPPNQSKVLDILEENQPKLNTSCCEIYFLGAFNIILFENGKYVFEKSSSNNKNLDSFKKKVLWMLQSFRFETTD